MSHQEHGAGIGLEVNGELNSTNASGRVRIPLFNQETGAAVTLAVTQYLTVALASIVAAVTGNSQVFFETDDLAAAEAITGIADGGAGEDTVIMAGDRSVEFETGRVFTIANATANDGSYTSTGSSYDSVNDQTTVNVATASWTDTAVDGDITSTSLFRAGTGIIRGTYVASGGEVNPNTVQAMRRGRAGQGIWAIAPNGVMDAHAVAFVRKIIIKSGPVGIPVHAPA